MFPQRRRHVAFVEAHFVVVGHRSRYRLLLVLVGSHGHGFRIVIVIVRGTGDRLLFIDLRRDADRLVVIVRRHGHRVLLLGGRGSVELFFIGKQGGGGLVLVVGPFLGFPRFDGLFLRLRLDFLAKNIIELDARRSLYR